MLWALANTLEEIRYRRIFLKVALLLLVLVTLLLIRAPTEIS